MSAVSEADVKENGVEATIENVGAVIQSKIRLVPGALTLLIGDNGVGKTTVQRAITGSIAHSGKGLTPRDGVDAGNVEIGSVKCRIGKRLSYKGDPAETFVLIEGGEDLKELIDPGIERASSADEARIKALIRMSGATIPTEAFVSVVGDPDWKTFTQQLTSRRTIRSMLWRSSSAGCSRRLDLQKRNRSRRLVRSHRLARFHLNQNRLTPALCRRGIQS